MEAIILLGAPGAGKGTIAEGLKQRSDFIHVSTGDMLREAIKAGSDVGLKAKSYMERGDLVPDDVIIDIVKARMMKGAENARYMFDGFPRTTEQARLLDEVFAMTGSKVSHVFLLEVPRNILVERLSGRRICRNCGAVYHVTNIPSKVEGICDACGGELYQRPDDSKETVLNRLEVYENQTSSLIEYYEQAGVLDRIDAAKNRVITENTIIAAIEAGSLS